MTAFRIALAVALAGLIWLQDIKAAEENRLFEPESALSREQSDQLKLIQKRPTSADVTVVRARTKALEVGSVAIPLEKNIPPLVVDGKWDKAGGNVWFGHSERGTATLLVTKDGILGTINAGGILYRLEPLGYDLHALIKVDSSRFPPEEPPGSPRH